MCVGTLGRGIDVPTAVAQNPSAKLARRSGGGVFIGQPADTALPNVPESATL